MKFKTLCASIFSLSLLNACSGGGGGSSSSPSASTPAYVKSAKIQCGTKDCLTGTNVGAQSIEDAVQIRASLPYYNIELKDVFQTAKAKVASVNSYISLLNGMASDNGVTSCETVPTSGNLTYAGYTVHLGAGGGSADLGNGSRVPDHSVKLTDANSVTHISFKCGAPQFVWIVKKDIGTGNRDEYMYELNPSTNAIVVTWGATAAAGVNSLGYFKNDGSDSFSFAYFDHANNPVGGYNHSFVGGAKPFTMVSTGAVKSPADTFEFAYSYGNTAQPALGIDSVIFGEVNGSPLPISYRGCVNLYRTGSPQINDRSCSYDGSTAGSDAVKNFTASSITAPPVGSASAFSAVEAKNLSIADPASM